MKITKKIDITISVDGDNCNKCHFYNEDFELCDLYKEDIRVIYLYKDEYCVGENLKRCDDCIKEFGIK
jgi:hypothetical protein